ncbi:6-carboxytetrahydropterin synthase QueD [Niveibacterium sp. 24ML]|uniref:6-carboxytetrahydropterin synthase QueD n=1 Tax=Niveibacterium sp. 24ML TaxID=2985512 RepID=UPI00226EC9A8|nr:6-carboxytetrahydropterin synthase QueD [Niveibacterium sp. 24ML]MCX9157268.1 6-carboxytetrahydropterin synthase QueD [Niveibacterium sp. 24ML]
MRITRRLEFDAGHRIPHHNSQCKNLHGHRYTLEVTLLGETITKSGASDEGMVLDFSDVKAITKREIVDVWDHAFLVHADDTEVRAFLESIPGHKTVVLPLIPTAENLARIAFDTLAGRFAETYGSRLTLERVRLYETPNCWADAEAI